MKQLLLLILFMTMAVRTDAQSVGYSVHEPSTQRKMPVGNVHAVYCDKEGYIWYSTEENLCRDNGYQIDVFCSNSNHPNLISSNFILEIAEDNNHRLWFGTQKGTYILDKRDYSIHSIAPREVSGVECEALIAISDGTIWISAGHWLLHLDTEERVIQRISTLHRKREGKYANAFYEDSQGNLWLLENGGSICRYDKSKRTFIPYSATAHISPQRMVEDSNHGCYWIGTWEHGIYKFSPNMMGGECKMEPEPSMSSEIALDVIDLLLDSSHAVLWVSAMDGLHAYDIKNGHLEERSLVGLLPKGKNIVDRMTYDRHGNIWVAAFSPHTFMITPSNQIFRRDLMEEIMHKTHNSVIGDFAIAEEKMLWLWDPRIGLELQDLSTGKVALGKDCPDDMIAHGSGVITPKLSEKGLWMASDDQIIHLRNEGMQIIREPFATIAGVVIFGLYDSGDGHIWAATSKGVKKVDKNNVHRIIQVTDSNEVAYRIGVDRQGNYYFHTDKRGLMAFDSKLNRTNQLLTGNERCTCMTLDNNGVLWFGTDIGKVYRYQVGEEQPKVIEKLGNVTGARILDIKKDKKGHLWSVTSQVVKEWNPQNGTSRTFSGKDPYIQMDYFRTMAIYDDSVCVTGSMGYCMIPSMHEENQAPSKSKSQITSVVIDGIVNYNSFEQKEIDIPSSANIVELNLSSLDHLYAPQLQYAYRLCKLNLWGKMDDNAQWNILPIGENIVRFTSLQKGDYVLQVRVTDRFGIWGDSVDVFTLHRLPAWWETWWAYALYAILAASLIFWGFKSYSKRIRRKKVNQMEKELTEMKFKFFTNISHELRTPLTLIMLPLEQMIKSSKNLSSSDRNRLEKMHDNAKELLEMINQLLDFRRMELGNIQLNAKNGDMVAFLQSVIEVFRPMASKKQISLSFLCPQKVIYLNFDHEKIQHVVWNLLSNALKFTQEGGSVSLTLEQNDADCLKISVQDNGIGISSDQLPHVFDRYYQASDNHAEGGSGIGLHLVSEFVRLHGGKVAVESEVGKGTTFWFMLPMKIETCSSDKPNTNDSSLQPPTSMVVEDVEKNTLLLVEDNVEFRSLMAETLHEEGYVVVQASNGLEALRLLESHPVDMIISDMMMPKMDGFELCRQVKTNLNTSHIPLILLTAKTGDENRLEGYKMGADYYMTKPFSMDILLNRIKHLQSKRKTEQVHFQHEQNNDVVGITRSKIDEEFLTKAIQVMEAHIDDEAFNVESFSQEMCTSRMTLYRKIQNITGLSPSDFITTIRLKRAAHLLKETSLSVAIISEKTGFSSPSYFSKSFKKMFGVLPKDYRGQTSNG